VIRRRDFLQSGGLALAGLAAGVRVRRDRRPASTKTVICVLLRGGADALSVVVPHGDDAYYALRPTIAVPRPRAAGTGEGAHALDLDGDFGLHPALAPLLPLWRRGMLAPVVAVGAPVPTSSHAEAQRFLMEGVLGGGASLVPAAPGVASGLGDTPVADYPHSPLGRRLAELARLVKEGAAPRVAFADASGWDTHVHQGGVAGPLALRLDDLARAVAALAADLGDRMDDVVVMALSEFGRSARENASGGTEHGQAGAVLVIGGAVRGGRVYGRWPGLAPDRLAPGSALATTTDVRAVVSEITALHLGVALPGSGPVNAASWVGLLG
jgi:uncharacterized protein (DUF1501 family)